MEQEDDAVSLTSTIIRQLDWRGLHPELEARLRSMGDTIRELKHDNLDCRQEVRGLRSEILTLREELEKRKVGMPNLDDEVARLATKVEIHVTTLSKLDSDVEGAYAYMKVLNDTFTAIKAQLRAISSVVWPRPPRG